jgi:Putative Ig domain
MRGVGGWVTAAIVVAVVLVVMGASPPALAVMPAPDQTLGLAFAPGSPAPPVLNQPYAYAISTSNDGNVPLDDGEIEDTVPVQMALSSVTTGSYTGLTDFAAGEGVRVSYEKNTAPGVFTLWGSSPNTSTNTTLTYPPPGLGAGEYVTRLRWEYGETAPGMRPTAGPVVAGRVTNPDNAGGPVAVGDAIQNCATMSAVYVPGPTNILKNVCQAFNLIAGPAITIGTAQSTPLGSAAQASATLTGGSPTGTITFGVFAASDADCSSALLDEDVPVNGVGSYTSPTFTAPAAGAYKWVARYNGDALHAAAATGCNDPSGAFAVVAPPAAAASFGAATISVGETTPLTFTITNPPANTVSLTGVALDDMLPPGLAVAAPNGLTGSCGTGTIAAAAGSQSVTLVGGSIPVGSSCSFSVDVSGSAPGAVTNATGAVQSGNGGAGNAATATLTVNQPPAINGPDSATFITGQAGSVTFTTTSDPVAAVSDAGAALPAGVSFVDHGDGTATLSGTPAPNTGGMYRFALTATNGVSPDATQPFILTVDQAPAITSASSVTFLTGRSASLTVTSTGFPAPKLSNVGAALPGGLSFEDNGDGTATLSGTPSAASGGAYKFSITAANGVSPDATQTFTLIVSAPPTVRIVSPAGGATYGVEQSVQTSFSCSQGAGSPGLSSCDDSSGANTTSGGSGHLETSTPGSHTYTVTARSSDGQTATRSIAYTVAAAPSVVISSPRSGAHYAFGKRVLAGYRCVDGAAGPGISACTASAPMDARIPTSNAGTQRFTVTAVSTDGQRTTSTVAYTVLPDRTFTITRLGTAANGTVRLHVSVPGPGRIDVLETAWLSNLAHAAVALQPAPHRFASARTHKTATQPGKLKLRVAPNRRGRRLVAHHTYTVTLRLWVTYTPTGGAPLSIGLYNVHLGCRSPAAINATPGQRTHTKAPAGCGR